MIRDEAIVTLHRELGDVRSFAKCSVCACFLGVLAAALADLKGVGGEEAAAARADFEDGLAAGRARGTTVCQKCEVCVPVGPQRRFREST